MSISTHAKPAQVLTFEETLARLNCSRSSLFRLVKDDAIKSFKLGRSRRFLEEDVEAFIRQAAGESNEAAQ